MSRQSGQPILTQRRQDVLLLWQTKPNCVFVTKQRTSIKRMLTTPKKMMVTHLQYGTHSEAMCKYTMDSLAYNHIISCSATFDTYEVIDSRNVYLDDDSVVEAIRMGCIIDEIIVKDKIKIICIKNTFHVPKLQANLLSVNKLLLDGLKVQFNLNEYIVRGPDREVNVIGLHKGNLYETQFSKVHGADVANLAQSMAKDGAFELGCRRLKHLNMKHIHALQSSMSDLNLGKVRCYIFLLICERIH